MYYRLYVKDNKGIFQSRHWHDGIPKRAISELSQTHNAYYADSKEEYCDKPCKVNEEAKFFFTEDAINEEEIRELMLYLLTKDNKIKMVKVENLDVTWEGKSGLQVAGIIPKYEQLLLPYIERR
jgi:hypothetical protein